MSHEAEASVSFDCFGASCSAYVLGAGAHESAAEALARARRELLCWHERFSRFEPASELSRLNRDPRRLVPSSPLMARLAAAVRSAGASSGGLVDGTLLGPLERAGYRGELERPPKLRDSLLHAPPRRPAAPSAARNWERIEVDFATLMISRPPGVELDSGGLAKGMFADVLAETLARHASFAINCAGDLAIGGAGAVTRPVHVASPFDGRHAAHVQPHAQRRRDERHRPAQLAQRRPPRASPARSRHRRAGVHRRRAGDGARAERAARRDPREGGPAERASRGPRMAPRRRRDRAR